MGGRRFGPGLPAKAFCALAGLLALSIGLGMIGAPFIANAAWRAASWWAKIGFCTGGTIYALAGLAFLDATRSVISVNREAVGVRNPMRKTRWIPGKEITGVEATSFGLVLSMRSGRRMWAWAVQEPNYRIFMGRPSEKVTECIDSIREAAGI